MHFMILLVRAVGQVMQMKDACSWPLAGALPVRCPSKQAASTPTCTTASSRTWWSNTNDLKCPPRCSGHLQRKYYFRFCKSGRAAAPPDLLFHGRGRSGQLHLLLLACGQSAEGELAFCGKESRNVPPGAMSFRYQMPLPAMTPLVKRQLRKIRRFSGVAIKNNISSNYGAAHAEPV